MWNQPLVSDVWPPNTARRYVRALHPLLPQRRDPFPFPLPLAFSFLSAFPVRVATVAPRSSHRDTTGPVSDVRYVVVLVVTQLDVTRDGTGQEGELGGFVPGQCLDCWGNLFKLILKVFDGSRNIFSTNYFRLSLLPNINCFQIASASRA